MGLILLDQGYKSKDADDQLISLFGAGISQNDRAFYILEEGLKSSNPQIQAIAINFLGNSRYDYAYELINKMMGSPYALIRLEAALQLAKSKHPRATAQIEALMQKVDPRAAGVFPQLFALVGDDSALKILKKLMNHTNLEVRIACMMGSALHGRDDLIPQIRKLASQHDIRQQEAACIALGIFQDQQSEDILKKHTKSPHAAVRIAALKSLYILGVKEAAIDLQTQALIGDLFAIDALGSIPGSESTLINIAKTGSIHAKLNAILSLLKLKDERALSGIADILIRDARDIAFFETATPGRVLKAWKAIPSAQHQGEDAPLLLELSLRFREEVLQLALELPEEKFYQLAHFLFEKKQNDLIPLLVNLLVNLDTEESIQLLKMQANKAGAPLIRAYATLGLVRLKEEGPYQKSLKESILSQKNLDMMKFRAFVPADIREIDDTYELTPHESSRFLIDAIQVLAETQEPESLDILLQLLKEGHPKNRPVIAGLILRIAI